MSTKALACTYSKKNGLMIPISEDFIHSDAQEFKCKCLFKIRRVNGSMTNV